MNIQKLYKEMGSVTDDYGQTVNTYAVLLIAKDSNHDCNYTNQLIVNVLNAELLLDFSKFGGKILHKSVCKIRTFHNCICPELEDFLIHKETVYAIVEVYQLPSAYQKCDTFEFYNRHNI